MKIHIQTKISKIFWGFLLILAASLLICDGLGILTGFTETFGGVSAVRVVLGVLMLAWLFSDLFKGHLAKIFFPLAFLFMLFEPNIAYFFALEDENILNNWLVFGCAVLLAAGVKLLFGGRGHRCHKAYKKTFDHSDVVSFGDMGSRTRYIDCADFSKVSIENTFGVYTVHFENTEAYVSGGHLKIENNLGRVIIYVPSSWRLIVDIESNLGSTVWPNNDTNDGPTLKITGENNLGSIEVKKI